MKLAMITFAAAALMAGAALAQDGGPPPGGGGGPSPEMRAMFQAAREACEKDMASLCADKTDRREAFRCLRENIDKASQPCKDAVAKLPQRRPQ